MAGLFSLGILWILSAIGKVETPPGILAVHLLQYLLLLRPLVFAFVEFLQ